MILVKCPAKLLRIWFSVFCLINQCYAQTEVPDDHRVTVNTPEIALLDIESSGSGNDFTLSLEAPRQAGKSAVTSNAVNNSLWLNYTSIVNKSLNPPNNTRKILVKISEGSVPAGLVLKLKADAASSHGKGTKGISTAQITLSAIDQQIIRNIGSCYTGQGGGKGHRLVYTLDVIENNFALLDNDKDNTELVITFTITDN